MSIPADDAIRSDKDLHHLIESEIHSLSTRLGSPLELSPDEIDFEIARLNSLLDLFRRRDEIVRRLIDGSGEDEPARLRRQLLSQRARLGRNFNHAIRLLAQSLCLRQMLLATQVRLREQILLGRKVAAAPLTPPQPFDCG